MALVNKAELADLIRCSLPTLANLIKRYPDLPIEQRGRNGEQWQFDPEKVIPFLEGKRAEAVEQNEARADLLDQFRLPIDDQGPPEERGLTPQQQLAAVKTRMLLAKEAREAGLLVPVSDVRVALQSAIGALNQSLQSLPAVIGRRYNLPEAVVIDMRATISAEQAAFVKGLGSFAPPSDAAGA